MKNRIHFFIPIFVLMLTPFLIEARKHSGPEYSARTYESLEKCAEQFAKTHNLQLINCCVGSGRRGVWGVSLTSDQKLTMDQARQFSAELAYQLLYRVFNDPSFAKYCEIKAANYAELPKWQGHECTSPELKEEFVSFRLAFWDQNNNRPCYPFIAQVRLEDGNLYFHYADPKDQALQEPIIVSLKDLNLPNYRPSKQM